MRSGALLLVGRQGGTAVFVGAVVALPRFVDRPTFNSFMWAYVIQLFVSSVLAAGLERMVAGVVAASNAEDGRQAVKWALTVRALLIPVTALVVLAGLWVVHVSLPWLAVLGLVVWTAAVQLGALLFAVLRALKRVWVEPAAITLVRVVQTVGLLAAAAASSSVSALILVVAVPELILALALLRTTARGVGIALRSGIPWRLLSRYTAIELFGFVYLRADIFVVGHLLGSGPGATYSLAYRVVDGLTGAVTPFLLHLFPAATRAASEPGGVDRMRRALLPKAPPVAALASLLAMFAAVGAGRLVPRLGEARAVLQVLVITIPLYAFSAVELHLRSAEGRNRLPLALGATLLVVNVGLNWVLVARYGLISAAWVLVACELAQAGYLAALLVKSRILAPHHLVPLAVVVACLAATGALLARSTVSLAFGPALVCVIACASAWVAGRVDAVKAATMEP